MHNNPPLGMQTHFDFSSPEKLPLLAQALFLVPRSRWLFFFTVTIAKCIYFFLFSCAGSLLLHAGFSSCI